MKYNVPSIAVYTKVLAGLLLLTLLTFIQPSLLHLSINETIGVQLMIALMKILLVAAYYMHLRSELMYLKGYVIMSLIILLIFFIIVGIDVSHI